jgi:hypothetical protein
MERSIRPMHALFCLLQQICAGTSFHFGPGVAVLFLIYFLPITMVAGESRLLVIGKAGNLQVLAALQTAAVCIHWLIETGKQPRELAIFSTDVLPGSQMRRRWVQARRRQTVCLAKLLCATRGHAFQLSGCCHAHPTCHRALPHTSRSAEAS